MRRKICVPITVIIFCLTLAACLPGARGEERLATRVAATIHADRTTTSQSTSARPSVSARVATGTPPPASVLRSTRTSSPTPRPTATPSGPPLAEEQVLRLNADSLSSIDPFDSFVDASRQAAYEMFVGLTRQDEVTAEVKPGVARSWEVSQDGLVWTFYLRQDVPWVQVTGNKVQPVTGPDGVRYVSADDFEYGLKRLLDPEAGRYVNDALYLIKGARDFQNGILSVDKVGIRALDDRTLEVRLIEPASHFDAVMGAPFAVAMPEWLIQAKGDEWTEARDVQSYGPYALADWVPESHLTLVRNPHWPATKGLPQPTIEEISWQVMTAEESWAAFRQGKLDVLELSGDALDRVAGDPALSMQPLACTYFLGYNVAKPPFDDPRVRLAFSLAVDREALIADSLGGLHDPARWFTRPGLRAAPDSDGFDQLGVTFAPDEARSLLDEVYPDRSHIPPIAFVFPDSGPHAEVAQGIGEVWSGVLGVQVDLKPMDWGPFFASLQESTPNIWRLSQCAYDYADASHYLATALVGQEGFAEGLHWSNDAFSKLLREAAAVVDVEQRTDLYAQAEDILVRQEAAIVPIYWSNRGVLTQPQIQRTFSQLEHLEHLEKWKVLAVGSTD